MPGKEGYPRFLPLHLAGRSINSGWPLTWPAWVGTPSGTPCSLGSVLGGNTMAANGAVNATPYILIIEYSAAHFVFVTDVATGSNPPPH